MNTFDAEEFRRQGHLMIDFLADYYHNIENFPVRSQVSPGYLGEILPDSAPHDPEAIETILEDVRRNIIPGITHWQSPNFFAYFPITASTPGFLGEMLATGLNIVAFNWMSSPAATELENIVMDWLGKMLQLPKSFLFCGGGGGILQGTTSEAMLCTLLAARDKILRQHGMENIGRLVVYCSDQTHSAFLKAAKIAGMNPKNFRKIKTSKSSNFQLCPIQLDLEILSDMQNGLIPVYLCVTIGTTSSTAVDPLEALQRWEKSINYGFTSMLHMLEVPAFAPSLDTFLMEPSDLIKSLSTYPEYLRNHASDSNKVVDYKDWQIMLSRRFRAMKLWFVLRSYGVNKLRNFIRGHVEMAKCFEGMVDRDKRFEVLVPRLFSMVCFRVSPSAVICGDGQGENDVNEMNRKLLESVNGSGKVYASHTVLEGVYTIRFAIGATLTNISHVSAAWKVIQKHADALLA